MLHLSEIILFFLNIRGFNDYSNIDYSKIALFTLKQ